MPSGRERSGPGEMSWITTPRDKQRKDKRKTKLEGCTTILQKYIPLFGVLVMVVEKAVEHSSLKSPTGV